MGNIRQINVKKIAIELLEKYLKQFIPGDSQQTKGKIAELPDVKSILLRNCIFGYVARRLSPQTRDKVIGVVYNE